MKAVPNLYPGPKQWRLHLTSWAGQSLGAEHTYARLDSGGRGPNGEDDYDGFELECVLTAADAKRINAKDRSGLYTWRTGQTMRGFWTREDAIAASMAAWTELADDGDALRIDDYSFEEGELLAGSASAPFIDATRFGAGTKHRYLRAVVKKSNGKWKLIRVED